MNSTQEQLLEIPQNDYFNSFAVVKKEVDDALLAHQSLYKIYDKHEKYFNGEASMSVEARKKLGLGWMECWNYGKAMNKIRQIVVSNQRIMRESLFLSQPSFRTATKSDEKNKKMFFLTDKRLLSQVGEHVSHALACALEADSRTNQFFMDVEYPALTFGYSAILKRENDWMPEVLHPRHIAFPKNTSPNDIRRWVTFSEIRAEDLYNIWTIKRKESAVLDEDQETGKNLHIADSYVLEGLEQTLWAAFQDKYQAGKTANGSGYKEWQDVVNDFSNRCQYIIQNTLDVQIAKLVNREIDGSLSEVWIPFNRDGSNISYGDNLLFKKNHGKLNQNEAIVLVKDSGFTDNGYIAKLRGISKMAVEDGLRYDKARNMVTNKANMIGMPYVQTQGINQNVANSIEVTQGFGVLKSGTQFVENQPNFDLSSHLNLLQYQENEYRQFSKDFDPSIEGKLSNRPTKGEVSAISGEAAGMEQAKASVKLSDYSKVVKMMLIGMCEAVTEEGTVEYDSQEIFFAKLISKLKAFGIETKADCIKVIKAIDFMPIDYYGMTLDTLRTMLTMAETPQSRNRIYRMMLLRMGVPRNEIDLHAPYEESGYRSIEDEALVAIENNMFLTTTNVIYSDSHDPISHLDGHYKQVDEIFNGVGEGALDTTQAYKWSANVLEHCKLHLQFLKDHPFYNNRFSSYKATYDNLVENLIKLKIMAEQEQQAQIKVQQQAQEQQQQGVDPVQAAKIRDLEMKAESKARREQFLTGVRMKTRQEQQAFNNALRLRKQDFDEQIQERQAMHDAKLRLMESTTKQLT